MKSISWLLITTLLMNCSNLGSDKETEVEPVIKKVKSDEKHPDSLKVFKLYSSVEDETSSLILRHDTVYIFIKNKSGIPFRAVSRFCYESSKGRFNLIRDKNRSVVYDTVIPAPAGQSAIRSYYFKEIGEPGIKYINPTPDLISSMKIKSRSEPIKLQRFGNKIYGIQETWASGILVYDTVSKKTDSLNFGYTFHEVTDFFLYDLDKDENPEIFIFNIGVVPREDVVSFDVYSIRQDSITVNFLRPESPK